jgi:hypothetical protein
MRRASRYGQVTSDAADALDRARAELLLSASAVFVRLALAGTDEFLARARLEELMRARPHPTAVARELERPN